MTNASSSGRGFGYWLNIFANLAVVGGIVFLGIEVRQNTQMMRAQTRGMREALQRQWQGGVEGDQFYLRNFANTMLRLWENIYYQYQSGLFEEAEFQAEIVAWDRVTRQPFVMDYWNSSRDEYSETFRAVIDSLIALH